jgi:GWxTD domain-containing protein
VNTILSGPSSPAAARPRTGTRRVFIVAVLALVALPCPRPARAEHMDTGMPWRIGGRVGFTLDAYAIPDSSGEILEVALRVPPATVEQLALDGHGSATLKADFKVKGHAVGKPMQAVQTFSLVPGDSAGGQGHVVLARFPVVPGGCDLDVRLTDLVSKKPGPGANYSQNVSGGLTIPPAQAGREISDIEFLWPAEHGTASLAFVRSGRTVVPNPDRLYGLLAGELRARFVARARAGDAPRPWHWIARVFDGKGQGVAQAESTAAEAGNLDTDVAFDLTSQPAGAYSLDIKAWQEGDAGALERRAAFSIGWQPDTWLRNAADIADDVHFLLSANDEEQFTNMPPGAQEVLLQNYWARRDPTPETAVNEALEAFNERVRYANENFTRPGASKGMFTDMGRVYIRYGEPSEVSKQVIPAGSETLTEELQQIIEQETRLPDSVHSPGPGGDMRPFEVWLYEDATMPLDVDPHEQRGRVARRLVFLFVDEQGTGVYRLRYSTE